MNEQILGNTPTLQQTQQEQETQALGLQTPRPATGVSRALRARSVPKSVPENGGVRASVPWGVFGARTQCPGHSGIFYSRDTFRPERLLSLDAEFAIPGPRPG